MKTLTQIGKAALSRIFKPEQKGDVASGARYQFERTVIFTEDHGTLEIPDCEPEDTDTGLVTFSVRYKVWSIELGLRDVKIQEEDENLYKAIYREYLTEPSHIIVISTRKYIDYYDHYTTENEDVCIYRVTMENTDCFDNSFEKAFYEEQESQLPFMQTGNGSWLGR
ncbi:MAG TPA: hypothetical protein VFE57_02230 [Cyclobacteriaceae bacterium]|nr:hypothetical protein [Cyclobacteriaceae bacterium]